ncbi:MAG TPA: cytosine permease [Gaiellaceae bacterium]
MAPDLHEEIAHDVDEFRADLSFERAELGAAVAHDYSTAETGIVPLEHRRPMWHFMGLWTTFVAGFSYMFLGFEIHDGGHSLASTVAITLIGYGMYAAYAMFGSYLGSRTGQTHALLTRSVFGLAGSWIVSAFILVAPLGWVAFQANLLVTLWDGFYGWGSIFTLTLLMAGVMIFNNLLGFTGISVFARYLVTPILILWCIYMILKGFIADGGRFGGTPATGFSLPFWVAVVAVIGFSMWGNEPDFWRYGKPRFMWPLPTYIFSAVLFTLFVMAGWMMETLANSADSAAIFRYTVHYSLFGAFWLAWIIATVSQIAINDGNYYESVNAGQNLLGSFRRWPRPLTCLLVAGGGVIAADLVNFHFLNGWFKVASFLAVTVPSATVIMAVDHFLLPRLFRISRPLDHVPRWEETGFINLPAVIALLAAVFFGVTGTASWPHGWLEATAPNSWGPVPLEAWAIAGGGYIALVAVVRGTASAKQLLGFSKPALASTAPGEAIVDIASAAETGPGVVPAPASA